MFIFSLFLPPTPLFCYSVIPFQGFWDTAWQTTRSSKVDYLMERVLKLREQNEAGRSVGGVGEVGKEEE